MSSVQHQLETLGLSYHEAALYLAIVREPRLSVTDLSRRIATKRTTVYEYLDALLSRGLLRKIVVGRRIRYEAAPPKTLVDMARSAERTARENVVHAERIAESLSEAASPHGSRVAVYEGKRGLEEAYRLVTDTWQDLYSVFSPQHFFKHFSHTENEQLLGLLRERDIRIFDLLERSKETERHLADYKGDGVIRAKLLPKGVAFSTDIIASAERLALISFASLTATVIEDKMLAQAQRQTLKVLWGML